DGIRVFHVTGVQTCALPISDAGEPLPDSVSAPVPDSEPDSEPELFSVPAAPPFLRGLRSGIVVRSHRLGPDCALSRSAARSRSKIGRATCRQSPEATFAGAV